MSFTKEEFQMANKYVGKCLTSSVIKYLENNHTEVPQTELRIPHTGEKGKSGDTHALLMEVGVEISTDFENKFGLSSTVKSALWSRKSTLRCILQRHLCLCMHVGIM